MNYAESIIDFIIKCDIEYAKRNGMNLDVYKEFYPQFFTQQDKC